VALTVALAAPPLLLRLGRAPFDDPGEGQHAEIARELLQARDPFALTLGGVGYVDKPPLLYALMALVFAAAGQSEGTARAVPAAAALAAVGATAWLVLLARRPSIRPLGLFELKNQTTKIIFFGTQIRWLNQLS